MIHENWLARFFSLSLDLLATANDKGFFEHLNPAWERILGYSLAELTAAPFIDFVHPEDQASTQQEAAKLFRGEHTIYFENRYRRKDGSYCWLAWTASYSAEDRLIFACARDISLQKTLAAEREQALSALARFQALADSTSDFVGMVDAQHEVVYMNPAGRRLTGQPERGPTSSMADIHPPEYGQRILSEVLPAALARGSWTGEGWILNGSGQSIPVSQVVVALYGPGGEHTGFGTIMRDLSNIESYKKTQAELLRQQAVLRETLQAMSTPIIPLTERIVVLPLIGSMDSERATEFLNATLEGAERTRAQVVIIDITGMGHVDTGVGVTLIKAASALRLLGAEVVLTGIRAEVAQTLVSLGVELPLNTRSTLQSGIAYALSISGERLVSKETSFSRKESLDHRSRALGHDSYKP